MNHHNPFSGWTDVVSAGRNELVFEKRNKEYGAFVIRRDHNKTVLWAMFLSFTGLFLAFGIPYFLFETPSIISATKKMLDDTQIVYTVNIPKPVNPDPVLPQKPPMPPPPTSKPVTNNINYIVDDHATITKPMETPVENPSNNNASEKNDGIEPGTNVTSPTTPSPEFTVDSKNELALLIAEKMPEFPGGKAAFYRFLQNNLVYPEDAKLAGKEGKVFLTFIIDKQGKLINIKVEQGVDRVQSFEKEAMSVLMKSPAWIPGMQGNLPVSVQMTIPISFKLSH